MAGIPERAALRLARMTETTDVNGDVVLDIKIPGTIGKVTRLADKGEGWFANPSIGGGDWVEMHVVDVDGIMAAAGTIVGTYTDTEVPVGNQGWYIPPSGIIEIGKQADSGRLVAGLYLRIVAHRSDGAENESFFVNIKWGAPE